MAAILADDVLLRKAKVCPPPICACETKLITTNKIKETGKIFFTETVLLELYNKLIFISNKLKNGSNVQILYIGHLCFLD